MQTQHSIGKWLVATFLLAVAAYAQVPNVPGVPPISVSTHTTFQQQTHFLTFQESFIPESAATAKAYYRAIDPTGSKVTFQQWLVNAGFIGNVNQWHPSGRQTIVNTPGVYGDNIINTDSHVIVVNAADLGFVRNQFIRCKPSCTARNPIIYTYLENYPSLPLRLAALDSRLRRGTQLSLKPPRQSPPRLTVLWECGVETALAPATVRRRASSESRTWLLNGRLRRTVPRPTPGTDNCMRTSLATTRTALRKP